MYTARASQSKLEGLLVAVVSVAGSVVVAVGLLIVQSAFNVAPLGVRVHAGGTVPFTHTHGRVPAAICHATLALLSRRVCWFLLGIHVVGAVVAVGEFGITQF